MTVQLALALEDTGSLAPATRPNPGRHLCTGCGQRPARFQYLGQVKADRSHTLCFQCYRAARDRARVRAPQGATATADTRVMRTLKYWK